MTRHLIQMSSMMLIKYSTTSMNCFSSILSLNMMKERSVDGITKASQWVYEIIRSKTGKILFKVLMNLYCYIIFKHR